MRDSKSVGTNLLKMTKPVNLRVRRQADQQNKPPTVAGPVVHGLDSWGGHTKSGIPWEARRGDAKAVLATMKAGRFSCVVTSPSYYSQRDYGVVGQIGLEKTIVGYVNRIVDTGHAMSFPKRTLDRQCANSYCTHPRCQETLFGPKFRSRRVE
jgi:hypothetical protein